MIEEKSLRGGHVAVLLSEFDTAEKLFLESTRPIEALHVRVPKHIEDSYF